MIDDKELGVYVQRWGDSQDVHYGDIHRFMCHKVTINYTDGFMLFTDMTILICVLMYPHSQDLILLVSLGSSPIHQ